MIPPMTRILRLWPLACGVVLICASPARAQGLDFGVKGGVNVADVDVSGDGDGPSFDSRVGLVAGGFVRMPIASWLAVQAEGLLSAWVPQARVLFTSDVVNPGAQGQVPPLGSAELVALARARGFSPERYAGGHGVAVPWTEIERAASQNP